MQATIVFQKNWDAIHLKGYVASLISGSRYQIYRQRQDGTFTPSFESELDLSNYRVDDFIYGHLFLCDVSNRKELGEDHLYQRYRYIVNTGSSRSSKTGSLVQCCHLYARENKDKRITAWRDTKKDCKDTVLNDAIAYLKKWGEYKVNQDFNKTESIFTYSTGSTFEIHGTDDEEKVMGLNKAVTWLNEPYKISKDTFDQLDQRTEDFVIIDWNPKKSHWIEDVCKDPRTIVIHSTFKDNPFCPAEQRAKILSYQPVKRCRLVVEGVLIEQDAKAYDILSNPLDLPERDLRELSRCRENESKNSSDDFKWLVYGLGMKGERPNRIFRWEPFSLEDYLKLEASEVYATDWGVVDPWGIIAAKYHDGRLIFRQRNYESENQIRARLTPTELAQIQSTESDAERNAGASEGGGIVRWMFSRLGIKTDTPVICDTNRPLKIAALRRAGYNRALPAAKGAGSIEDGIDLLNNIRCYYTTDSPDLEYEQENYSRKVDRYGVVLDEPEDINNHTIDCCRYIAQYLQSTGVIRAI